MGKERQRGIENAAAIALLYLYVDSLSDTQLPGALAARAIRLKLKVKEPLGCLLVEAIIRGTRFSMPPEQCFGTMLPSSALSQLHIRSMDQLLQIPSIICPRSAKQKIMLIHRNPEKTPIL